MQQLVYLPAAVPFPHGQFAAIRIADAVDLLPECKGAVATLDCVFHDVTEAYGNIRPPVIGDALQIRDFARANEHVVPYLVASCTAGVGRSQAVVAALTRIRGGDPRPILRNGTYNRRLYQLLLESESVPLEPEPLVSIVCRVKYDLECAAAFWLSMRRQRYRNWELVFVTDGPNMDLRLMVDACPPAQRGKVQVVETACARGRWGHPHRQAGIDAARGEYIGLQNDDNYLTPAFVEQLLFAMDEKGCPMAACRMLHRYSGWDVVPAGTDLACWLAHRDVLKAAPWPGNEFTSDQDHFQALLKAAGGRCAEVRRPLVCKN